MAGKAAEPQPSRPTGSAMVDAVIAEAVGHPQRRDPVMPGSGGPAGNAQLTAWTGLLLLPLIVAELITLLDVTGLLRWHVGVGIVLTALAVVKAASTGWRILRYYTGAASYRSAGPPPLMLRLLGPLVIAATLAVLGSGLALLAVGPNTSDQPLLSVLGKPVSPVTIHQGCTILFLAAAGLHLLARLAPAVLLASGRARRGQPPTSIPGRHRRTAALLGAALAGGLAIVLLLPSATGWRHHHPHDLLRDHRSTSIR